MNKKIVEAIARKDIKSTFSSKKVWVPMIILSLVLCNLVPFSFSYVSLHTDLMASTGAEDMEKTIDSFITNFPKEEMRDKLVSLPELNQKAAYFFLNVMVIPFFLIVAIINSLVTSSNSFAGEKERKTLETLLFAPISIADLFTGKLLASLIPAIAIIWASFFINVIIVNLISYSVFEELVFLNATWLILMFLVIPALVIFNIVLNILISARVKTFQEAQQFGGILVLPIIGLIVSQVTGLFFLSPIILLVIGVALLAANALLLKVVMKYNQRNALFESQVH